MERKIHIFWKIFALVIVWRLGLFGIGIAADRVLEYKPSFPYAYERLALLPVPRWLYSWANFDGVHYLTIVRSGYVGTASIQAFFPVFPLLLELFSEPPVIGGIILNILLAGLMAGMLYFLARLDLSERQSHWSVLALLLFPTSVFFGGLYTEPLFLLLVFASFFFARNKQWLLAGILAGLASGTRIIGIALLPALLVELWQQKKPESLTQFLRANTRELIFIALSALGLASYMSYLWLAFADPLYFFHVQQEFGVGRQTSIVLFPQVVWRYIKILWEARPIDWKYWSYVQDFVASLGVLGAFLIHFKKIRPSYLVFSAIAFFLPPLTGTLSSMPRYILACFPLFLLLGQFYAAQKPAFRALLLTGSVVLLIINTVLFIQGYWVA